MKKFFGSQAGKTTSKKAEKTMSYDATKKTTRDSKRPLSNPRFMPSSMLGMERSETLEGFPPSDSESAKERRILSVNSADTLFGSEEQEFSSKSGAVVTPRSKSYCKTFSGKLVKREEIEPECIIIESELVVSTSPDSSGETYDALFCNKSLLMYHKQNQSQVANIRINTSTRVTPSVDGKQFALLVEGMRPIYLQANTVLLNLKWVSKIAASTLNCK